MAWGRGEGSQVWRGRVSGQGHEIGHLHGGRMADLPFPVKMREELVEAGEAQVHHVLPQTGWVSYRIRGEQDVAGALGLFKKNYERLTASRGTEA
jgi:hypothetical protein